MTFGNSSHVDDPATNYLHAHHIGARVSVGIGQPCWAVQGVHPQPAGARGSNSVALSRGYAGHTRPRRGNPALPRQSGPAAATRPCRGSPALPL
ncbi:hypothetical protein JCM9534A_62740 [Catenuloplanes indicus JCM 9534]